MSFVTVLSIGFSCRGRVPAQMAQASVKCKGFGTRSPGAWHPVTIDACDRAAGIGDYWVPACVGTHGECSPDALQRDSAASQIRGPACRSRFCGASLRAAPRPGHEPPFPRGRQQEDVDGRDEPGHDDRGTVGRSIPAFAGMTKEGGAPSPDALQLTSGAERSDREGINAAAQIRGPRDRSRFSSASFHAALRPGHGPAFPRAGSTGF